MLPMSVESKLGGFDVKSSERTPLAYRYQKMIERHQPKTSCHDAETHLRPGRALDCRLSGPD
eukprot:1711072-Rhodomonas_salina.1